MLFKRILLKLSGESLAEEKKLGISKPKIDHYVSEIKSLVSKNIQLSIVIGGGNIFRGLDAKKQNLDSTQGDYMGMLATVINGLALQSALEKENIKTRVLSAIEMNKVAEPYIRRKAVRHLEKGRVVIFVAGTGNPYFTTDTAATLRALEIDANIIIKATRVDGVYTSDPEVDKEAIKIDEISYDEVYDKKLQIMDMTAFTLCRENKLPIVVLNINQSGNLLKLVEGQQIGTIIKWYFYIMNEEINFVFDLTNEKMNDSISHLELELIKIRAGRANPGMLDGVMVDYYGSKTPLAQIGNINTPDARTIVVQPWEKDLINEVKNAINTSNIGFHAQDNGEAIIINVPVLTEERRLELVKKVKGEAEKSRVSIRNVRKDGNDELKKLAKNGISEDLIKEAENQIQKFTDNFIEKVNKLASIKESELMKV